MNPASKQNLSYFLFILIMLCLVQARVSSKRFPKKMIKKINGNSILGILIDRLKLSKKISKIIVLTSKDISEIKISTDKAGRRARRLDAFDFEEIASDSPARSPSIGDEL